MPENSAGRAECETGTWTEPEKACCRRPEIMKEEGKEMSGSILPLE
jgi:hypothetical protein